MNEKSAVLIGATGLVGGYLLQLLLDDSYFETIKVLLRRPINLSHPKLEKKLVDFNDNDSLLVAIDNSDVIFCTVGTTNQKVKGDKDAYRKVDYDIPVRTAQFGKMTGCETYVLVSAVGANSRSRNFYLQLKGKVEDVMATVGLNSVYIMRPSLLLGDRTEYRRGEKAGKGIMSALSFLLPSKYKPIHAESVAKAMLEAAKENKTGFFVYEFSDMKKLSILYSSGK